MGDGLSSMIFGRGKLAQSNKILDSLLTESVNAKKNEMPYVD